MRQQRGDHASKQVAHAARGHAGIAPRTDVQTSIRIGNQATGTFQHHHRRVTTGELADGGKTILLHIFRGHAQQPRRFTGMRRQHGRCGERSRLARQQVQTIGIEYQRLVRVQRGQPQRMSPGALPQAGPECQHIGTLKQRLQCLRTIDRMRHQLWTCRIQRWHVTDACGDTDQAGTAAQCRFARQPNGASHAVLASNHQHMAVVALVGVATAWRQRISGKQLRIGPNAHIHAVRHAKRRQFQHPDKISRATGMQPAFAGNERHRDIGADHRPRGVAAIGIQSGRKIQCQHRHTSGIDVLDQRRDRPLRRAIEADAVQRINQQLRSIQVGSSKFAVRIPQLHTAAAGLPRRACQRRIAMRVCAERHQAYLQPCLTRQYTEQEPVATVVAGAAIDADMPNLRPVPTQAVQRCTGGPAHQVVTGDAQRRERLALHRTHLFDGIEIAAVRIG